MASFAASGQEGYFQKTVRGIRYHAYTCNPDEVGIYWADSNGIPFRTFSALESSLITGGHELKFMMNGGILPTLYDFAEFFRDSGCKTALFLDGDLSQFVVYPRTNALVGNHYGSIIAVTTKKRDPAMPSTIPGGSRGSDPGSP